MRSSQEYVVIVAGGSGMRMNSNLPKQFLELNGRPILMYSIDAFLAYNKEINVILVLPENQIEMWQSLCRKNHYKASLKIVQGGEQRFHSVKNGLDHVPHGVLVAVHDGVRPFVTTNVIEESFLTATEKGSAIASVKLKDSLRKLEGIRSTAVDRSKFRKVQTPQTFQSSLLKSVYEKPYQVGFTDEATVFEASGETIHLIEGDYSNIKITTPEDLMIAKAIIIGKKNGLNS